MRVSGAVARVGVVTVLALFAAGCRPESRSNAAARGQGAAAATGSAASAPDTLGSFVRFEAAGVPDYVLVRERGVGVVHLDPGPVLAGRAADTLNVRVRPDPRAGVVARLMLDSAGVFTFEARKGLLGKPGALEFGYQEVGFPILDGGADGWEQVYLGTAPGGEVVSGWAHAQPMVVGAIHWDEFIPGQPIFFALPPDSIHFFLHPDSVEAKFPVKPDDYILWPLDLNGDWMRVRAVTPSDYCTTPAPGARAPRQDTLWIRWRGETGRPRVWFYTKGC